MATTFNTVNVDGLIVRSGWNQYSTGPVELFITPDPKSPTGKGITQRQIQRLSLQSMTPDSLKALGSLRAVGDWLKDNRPRFRCRPEEPGRFYAHVALFVVLAIQEGLRAVPHVLANYSGIRPAMARMWIETARKLGMLTAANVGCHVGRAYGALTDKARETLSIVGSSGQVNAA